MHHSARINREKIRKRSEKMRIREGIGKINSKKRFRIFPKENTQYKRLEVDILSPNSSPKIPLEVAKI